MSTPFITSGSRLLQNNRRGSGNNRYRRQASPLRKLELPRFRGGFSVRMPGVPVMTGVWQWGVNLLLWPLFIIAASCACLLLYRYVTSHEYFTLREIEVSGNRRLTSSEVMQAGGVHLGLNTLDLAMHDVRGKLLGNPWIESATVTRELPATFRLTIVEREPRWWVQQDEGIFYADEQGRIIAPVEPRGFTSLPLIRLEDTDPSMLTVLNRLRQMAESKKMPFTMQAVGWVRLSAGGGVEMHLEPQDITVAMESHDLLSQVARLKAVWGDLTQRNELERVTAIRLAGEKLWVERSGPAIGASPAAPKKLNKGPQAPKKAAKS
ncbi:cell division protein FtsQ/DivIB [Megalodesulfovibrio paquesii]